MGRHDHGHFGWVDLSTTDMEAQTAFYGGLFGWTHHDEPTDMGPPYRMFASGGADVAGAGPMPPDMPPGMPSMWTTYVVADDVDVIAQKATGLGAQVTMPVMDVMEFGRMVGITDPTGATIFFWQPMGHAGAAKYSEPVSLVWNDLNTRDMAASADFYEALLRWDIDRSGANDPNYWGISVDGENEGGIMAMPPQLPDEVPAHWLVYFAVEDAREAAKRAVELGGKAEMEPMEIPVCVFCVLSDPAGAVFADMQMLERE